MLKELKISKGFYIVTILVLIIAIGGWYFYQEVLTKSSAKQVTKATIVPNEVSGNIKDPQNPKDDSVAENVENVFSGELDYSQQFEEENDEFDPSIYLTSTGLQNLRDPFQNLYKPIEELASHVENATRPSSVDTFVPDPSAGSAGKPAKEKNTEQNGVTYEDLIGTVKTPTVGNQNPAPVAIKPELQFPPFELKGVVSTDGLQKAILVVKGQSYIISKGDQIQEWIVKDVTGTEVIVENQKSQCFILTLEGVRFDETKI